MLFLTWKQSFNCLKSALFGNVTYKSLKSLFGIKITFIPLQLTFDSNFKIFKGFQIFLSIGHQNAISDLQTKFQLLFTSTFWKF